MRKPLAPEERQAREARMHKAVLESEGGCDYRAPPPPPVTGPHPWLTDGQYGQLIRNVHEALAAREPITVNDCVYAFDEAEGQYVIRLRDGG